MKVTELQFRQNDKSFYKNEHLKNAINLNRKTMNILGKVDFLKYKIE